MYRAVLLGETPDFVALRDLETDADEPVWAAWYDKTWREEVDRMDTSGEFREQVLPDREIREGLCRVSTCNALQLQWHTCISLRLRL